MLFRKYESAELYKNFKVAYIFGVVSLILAFLTIVSSLCTIIFSTIAESAVSIFDTLDWFDLVCQLTAPPLGCLFTNIAYVKYAHGACMQKTNCIINKRRETYENNDLTNIKYQILNPLLFWLLNALCSAGIGLSFGLSFGYGLGYGLGYWFLSYVFLFIGNIFLSENKKIIKNAWLINPPQWLLEEQKQKAEEKITEIEETKKKEQQKLDEAKKKEQQKLIEKCDNLLKTCGMKFFIKYCKQITSLPIRDVTITENYTQIERWQRLNAAKRIIDSNLTVMALTKTIDDYGNALSEDEVKKAKELIQEYKNG